MRPDLPSIGSCAEHAGIWYIAVPLPVQLYTPCVKRLELTRSGYLKPNRADMYQMHAYASAFRVSRLVLIYPADPDWGAVAETSFVLPGTKRTSAVVSVACVDVEDDNLPITVGANTLFNNLTPA
jgi:hypothetical protein